MKKAFLAFLFWYLSLPVLAANYGYVDTRAKNVPSKYDADIKELVDYLVKPYSKDEEKARVLLAWIVYHVDYDQFKSNQIKTWAYSRRRIAQTVSTGDIFQTRVGVCEDIAELYQRMALLAGLDAATIGGYAGYGLTRQNLEQNRHMWNAVKIDGKWALVDPTWAMKGPHKAMQNVSTSLGHQSEIRRREKGLSNVTRTRKNRTIDERWFMTKPRDMIETHYPEEDRWQLLSVPITLGSFLTRQSRF